MENLAIYAKRGYLGNFFHNLVKGDSILRLSGEVRGAQIADYIGAKINPDTPCEHNIFVKGFNIKLGKTGDYVDFSDQKEDVLVPKLLEIPYLNVIAHTTYAYNFLRPLFPNKMVYIPQQHINWENAERQKNKKLVCGYIGRPSHVSVVIQNEIKETLKKIDVEFNIGFEWTSREEAIQIYKDMDILVIGGYGRLPDPWQITPAKMINAASFGIPTISFKRSGYEEFEGYYTQFKTMDDLVREVEKFKNPVYYKEYSERIKKKAEEYHISKIAEKYKNLWMTQQ